MPPHALVVAHSRSPVPRLRYVRGAVASPLCLSVAVFAGCLGVGAAGLLGAALATLLVAVLAVQAARTAAVRRHLDAQARQRARLERDQRRLRLLRPSGAVRLAHYGELRALVDAIERIDPAEAERFELEDLLDHWTRRAVEIQRLSDGLKLAGAGALPGAVGEVVRTSRRRQILERRIRHRDDCRRRMTELAEELDAIDELVRLIAQRTACPLGDDGDREVERRLWQLDEVDAAMHQLSA